MNKIYFKGTVKNGREGGGKGRKKFGKILESEKKGEGEPELARQGGKGPQSKAMERKCIFLCRFSFALRK